MLGVIGGAMLLRNIRRVTLPQMVFVTVLGFFGGLYIWKPLIVEWTKEQRKQQGGQLEPAPISDKSSTSN